MGGCNGVASTPKPRMRWRATRAFRTVLAGLLALVFAISTAWAIRPELPFHPPANEAERALDAILHRVDADPDPLSNLLDGRGRSGFRPAVDYAPLLTPSLVAAIKRAETALLQRNCGGRYRRDEICGLDFVPLTCAQDSGTDYLYRTQVTRPNEAIVAHRWPGGSTSAAATYRLLRRAGTWRIDGIRCGEGMLSFNLAGFGIPEPSPGTRR